MKKYAAATAFLVATCTSFAAEVPRVRFGSLGDLHIGMSERQVAATAKAPLVHLDPVGEEEGCFYGTDRGLPKGASLMFVDGRLARIDISEPGVQTWSGAEVGMLEARVKHLYGASLRQEPHAYVGPEGHYLTLVSSDRTLGLRFETDGTRVTSYYAGTREAIQYIEGCQ
jgi:hypothetical protein